MPTFSVYPSQYVALNTSQTKNLGLAIEIEGVPDVLTNTFLFTAVKYGDPGIVYGLPDLVYGALRNISNVKPLISLEQTITLQQKIEPEQGRGAISTISISFVDANGYMTNLVTPGMVVDELLGNKLCLFRIGYTNSSYPSDWFTVFRGYVTSITSGPGVVTLQFSDANVKKRQSIGFVNTSTLTGTINSVVTTFSVVNADSYFHHILDVNGAFDTAIKTYAQIEDEVMEYGSTGISGNTFTVTRGSRNTAAVAHNAGESALNTAQLTDNCINLALKIMLSGWNGPCIEDIGAQTLGNTLDVLNPITNVILLNQDAMVDLGLTPGDQVTVTGSTMGNDGSYIIQTIEDNDFGTGRMLIIDTNLTPESPATGVELSFRSKYDTLPIGLGLRMTMKEVDVETHETIRDLFFSTDQFRIQLYLQEVTQNAKSLIEYQCLLPYGIYSITRFGRVSCGVTKPPLASDKLIYLNETNILNPEQISIQRAINTRRFFNIIQYQYDQQDDGSYKTTIAIIDSESLTTTNIQQALPIQADGVKSLLGGDIALQARGKFLLNRYKKGAFEINLKTNWEAGSLIEVTDPVVLQDNGTLKISNFSTGERDLGVQLFEVIQRTIDLRNGNVALTLLSNLGASVTDRFATISPSSDVVAGSTTTEIKIEDSYGALYPGNEKRKWQGLEGQLIRVHSQDYSFDEVVGFLGFNPTDDYKMVVDPPLSTPPLPGYIVDIDNYPTSTDASEAAIYKLLFCHLDPTLTVVTGTSDTVFDVSLGDAAVLNVGAPILIHNSSYSIFSPEVTVTDVTGTTVTVGSSLGFTPAVGQKIELVGFKDFGPNSGGPYRLL